MQQAIKVTVSTEIFKGYEEQILVGIFDDKKLIYLRLLLETMQEKTTISIKKEVHQRLKRIAREKGFMSVPELLRHWIAVREEQEEMNTDAS